MNAFLHILRAALACALAVTLSTMGWLGGALAQPIDATAAASPPAGAQARYDAALGEYELGHFHSAFVALAQLADEGHCEAARIASQMVRLGSRLYGTEFTAAPLRLARWRALPCPAVVGTR